MTHRSICHLRRIGNSSFTRLFLLMLLAIIVDARICCSQSKMPEFTGDRLTFSGVDAAAWQSLPAMIAELEQSGHETCYVVVVEFSGSGPVRRPKTIPIDCMNIGYNRQPGTASPLIRNAHCLWYSPSKIDRFRSRPARRCCRITD